MEDRDNILSYKPMPDYKNLPDVSVPDDADNMKLITGNIDYLKAALNADNAGAHNSVFRGKDITKYYDDGTLWTKISSGTFEDLFVGDYIVKNNITWRIAGFDYYLNKGDTPLKKHHAILIPDKTLTIAKMNEENTTVGGYKSSLMYSNTLSNVLETYIKPIFENHIISYRNLITSSINPTGYNRSGTNSGCSNGWEWNTRELDLLNEIQLYGSIIWSSSGYDIGIDNTQFSLFRLAPEFICISEWYWLRTIDTSLRFGAIGNSGYAYDSSASGSNGVRPYFLID